jgi:hypothetical protein
VEPEGFEPSSSRRFIGVFAEATTRNPTGAIADLMLRPHVKWRRRESNPLLLGASEVLCHQSFVPEIAFDASAPTGSSGDGAPPEPWENGYPRTSASISVCPAARAAAIRCRPSRTRNASP